MLYGWLILLVLWFFVDALNMFNPIYFASPIEVAQELVLMIKNGSIFLDIVMTLERVVIAIIMSALVGIPLGIFLGYSKKIHRLFNGVIDFLRSLPPIIFYPLFLIAFGTGDISRIIVALFGGAVVIILIVSNGLIQQSDVRRKYISSLGASKLSVLKDVIWYEALPYIFTSLRTASSLIIIIVIVTEMLVGARYGLGTRVQAVQITSNIPDLFATIIIIGIIGIIFNKFFAFLEKKYVFWKLH